MDGRAVIIGTGACFPEKILDNSYFTSYLDTTDEWIQSRTGIKQRRIVTTESTSYLGATSSKIAIEDAGLKSSDIDHIIVATATPDMLMPSVACLIQCELDLVNATAFDLNAACSGFIYALSVANSLVLSGASKYTLLCGVDVVSKYLDYDDRNTCVLFGDGAGSVIVTKQEGNNRGILSVNTLSMGQEWELLRVAGFGTRADFNQQWIDEKKHTVKMEGKEIFKRAVKQMAFSCEKALDQAGLTAADIDWLIPHQANRRIIEASADKLGIKEDRIQYTIQDYGNTIGATIPTTLDIACRAGKIKPGQKLLLCSFGAGLTYGAIVMIW